MSTPINPDSQVGSDLAHHLGLGEYKREGHDLTGPCVACKSSDAFRLHQQTGVAHCFSCGAKWSPFQLAEHVLGDREQAKKAMIAIGAFQPSTNGAANGASATTPDPIGLIAREKSIPRESLVAYGAKPMTTDSIFLPAYGPDGSQCTQFQLKAGRGKGLFSKGKPAGLFFPHEGGKVRLVVAWLLSTLRPRGPYPLLALFAEQGSGKSTAGKLIRSLVDPNAAPLRSEHRDARDLMIGETTRGVLPTTTSPMCRHGSRMPFVVLVPVADLPLANSTPISSPVCPHSHCGRLGRLEAGRCDDGRLPNLRERCKCLMESPSQGAWLP